MDRQQRYELKVIRSSLIFQQGAHYSNMFCFSAAAQCPGEAASIHWEGIQEIGGNYELLGEPNWIEDMSAQMDAFVTAGIEGIEVVQGRPNILSPLIIHTFPTE